MRKDPRLATSDADFAKQHELLLKIRDKLTATHDAITRLRGVRDQVKTASERAKGTEAEKAIQEAADALTKKLTAVEEALYQTKNRSSQDPLNYPIRLNNKLAALGGTVASADAAPTAQSYAVYDELVAKIDAELGTLDRVHGRRRPGLQPPGAREGRPGGPAGEALKAPASGDHAHSPSSTRLPAPGAGARPRCWLAAASRRSGGPIVLRLSHSMAAGTTALHVFGDAFRELAEAATAARSRSASSPSGTLGQEREVVQQLQEGLVDFMVSGTAIWGSVAPRLQVFDFPFLWRDWDHVHRIVDGPVGREAADYLAARGPHAAARLGRLVRLPPGGHALARRHRAGAAAPA